MVRQDTADPTNLHQKSIFNRIIGLMPNTIDLRGQLTAVIITYNRSAELVRTLERLLSLPEQFPLIVVDNASTDGTDTLIKTRFPQVEYLRLRKNCYAGARNTGAEAARTPFLAFTDDDCGWQPGSLALAVSNLDEYPQVAALVPRVLVYGERPDPLNRYFETSPLPAFVDMPGPSLMGFLEGNVVMRKEAFLQTGGYDPAHRIHGEGRQIAIKLVEACWGITYNPEVVAHHSPSRVRDTADRRRSAARNAILTAAREEPWENVLFEVNWYLKGSLDHPATLVGILEALAYLPRTARERRPISARMREYFKLLRQQRQELDS